MRKEGDYKQRATAAHALEPSCFMHDKLFVRLERESVLALS